ncbi:MAG: SMI1/KNR4 family protein [Planctomycetes bacterium]|nr:SMI1/KNR4 family protein [Planctomycetota bacterium]
MFVIRRRARTPAPVGDSWKRLERWLDQHFPRGLSNLRSGASVEDLDRLEKAIGQKLPEDVRQSWLLHDGEKEACQGVIFRHWLQAVHGICRDWKCWQDILPDQEAHPDWWNLYSYGSFPEGAIQHLYVTKGWIPLHDWDGWCIGVDLNPGPNGISGQVIEFGRHAEQKCVLALSWAHFLEDVADELEAGHFTLELSADGELATFCHLEGGTGPDFVARGYRSWAKAKLPRKFQLAKSAPRAVEREPSEEQRAGSIEVVRGFLQTMYEWEVHWLTRRPLQPLGLIRAEEERGTLTQVYTASNCSGRAERVFGSKYQQIQKEFVLEGRVYDEAMAQKRAILMRFAPAVVAPELFVQTDPPTFDPEKNTIEEVRALSPTHSVVYLVPLRSWSLGRSVVPKPKLPYVCEQIRYHVVLRNSQWVIQSREIRYQREIYHKLSF